MGLLTTFMENDIMPTKQQVTERRERWVEALRSGKYKQGKQVLHDIDNNTYCCLGVACDLFKDDTKLQLGTQNMYMSHQGTRVQTYDNHPFYLPVSVAEFLNIKDTGALKCGSTLGYKNDKGATFNEIADIIESGQLKELHELADESAERESKVGTMTDVSGHLDLTDSDVYDSIESFIKDGVSFTAYDVTKSLRKKGFWAEHNSVRDLVHDYLSTYSSCTVDNKEVVPGVWAKEYTPTATKNVVAPTPPSPTKAAIKGGANYAAGQGVKLQPTQRGGVSVPKKLINAIGLQSYDSVVLATIGQHTTLSAGYRTKHHPGYRVDKYGRVVITKGGLKDVGITDNQSVYAYVGTSSITLRDN